MTEEQRNALATLVRAAAGFSDKCFQAATAGPSAAAGLLVIAGRVWYGPDNPFAISSALAAVERVVGETAALVAKCEEASRRAWFFKSRKAEDAAKAAEARVASEAAREAILAVERASAAWSAVAGQSRPLEWWKAVYATYMRGGVDGVLARFGA